MNGQEQLHGIKVEMDGWTDNAMMVFSRHRGDEGTTHPDQINMLNLNEVSIPLKNSMQNVYWIKQVTQLLVGFIACSLSI